MKRTLTVEVLATPEALAKDCRMQNRRTATWHSCCPFPAAACPIRMADKCCQVQPEDWERVLQNEEPEPEPEFHFGDKVTHFVDFPVRAVFSAYKDSRHSGEAYVLFDGSPECQVVSVKNLKAGWE